VLSGDREAALIEAVAQTMTAQTATEGVSAQVDKSIAVLPFVNMSSDPEQEYFSDGLSEEILNLLAKVPGLAVTARTSSFAFKGRNEDVRNIGKTLSVSTVLEGSVRKSGERVRITAQLIDVASGTHLWSETYDRTLTDIFAVQDDVAAEILDALQVHVATAPTRGRPTENPEAYSLLLRAKAPLSRFDGISAEPFLRKAIELDPEFAEAYELLALSFWLQSGQGEEPAKVQELMHAAAAKALSIDPNLLFAQALFEAGKIEDYSYFKEIQAFERVVREDPSHEDALSALIYDLLWSGYFEEALGLAERVVHLNPLSVSAHFQLYQALKATGRRSEALESLKVREQLEFGSTTWTIGIFNLEEKNDEVAIKYLESFHRERNNPFEWIRGAVVGARDPVAGQAKLERAMPQIEAFANANIGGYFRIYLAFRFLDRFFEAIFDNGIGDAGWNDAESMIMAGTLDRLSGFTAHPKYLEVAEIGGLFDLWDERGAPDMCEKLDGQWVCE
jgi:TolB-like protein